MFWNRCWPVLGFLAWGLAGCQGTTTPPPVQLGHVANLSGPGRGAGEQAVLGIRLAVEEHNQDLAKGIGAPILVRHTDAQGKLEAFEAEAVRLVSVNKVIALLGGRTVAEVAGLERARVPLVTPLGYRSRGLGEQVLCTGLPPEFAGQVLARFAVQEKSQRHVTFLVVPPDEVYGDVFSDAASGFAKEFSRLVKDPAIDKLVTPILKAGEVKWKEIGQRLAKEKPACVFFAGSPSSLDELLREWPDPPLLLFPDPLNLGTVVSWENPKANVIWVTPFVADIDQPAVQEFVRRFRSNFKKDPDEEAALAYDNVRLLSEGLRQAQAPFSGEKLASELAKIKDFAGLTGSYAFAGNRVLKRPAFVVHRQGLQAKTLKRYDPEE